MTHSSKTLGEKAEARRLRITVFGGKSDKNQGTRTAAGRVFNKKIKDEKRTIPVFKGNE